MGLKPVYIGDEVRHEAKEFLDLKNHWDDIDYVMIPHKGLVERIRDIAKAVHNDFQGKNVLFVPVGEGARTMFSEFSVYFELLQRYSNNPVTGDISEINVKSYQNTESTKNVEIKNFDFNKVKGRNIILFEDIIDSGRTIDVLLKEMNAHNPSSVSVVALFDKRVKKEFDYKADYTGFSIPDKFVVGLGMDYNNHFRNKKHTIVLTEEAIEKYAH